MTTDDLKRADREVIGRYVELRQDGDRWKGLCPFHDDRNPSFVVYGDGKGWHCFACDIGGDVFDFLKRHEGLDFREAKRRVEELTGATAPTNQRPTERRIVEAYPYTDEAGELLYEVLRYEPKDFRQRRPDGQGGWTWSLGGLRRPLYRLPAVLKADEVFIVEGEKDVHSLEGFGFVATTNSGGASQAWQAEWTDALIGRRVVIIPDADEPGRKHAAKVREALRGAADEVLLVNLPDGFKDVSDFIAAGHGGADIRAAIEQERRKAAEADRPWWHSIGSMDDLKPEPVRWLLEPLIPEGAFVLLAGTPGSYKSFIALDIARAVATGESFAQLGVARPRDVLYVDLENPRNVIAARKEFLGIPSAPRLRYWGRWSKLPFFGVDSRELLAYAAAEKPLLIFDSLVRFHRSDENSNSEMSKVMGDFLALSRAGATVLLLHHAGKDAAKNARGAIEVEAAPDLGYRANRTADRVVSLFQFKNRLGAEQTFDLRLSQYGFDSIQEGGPR